MVLCCWCTVSPGTQAISSLSQSSSQRMVRLPLSSSSQLPTHCQLQSCFSCVPLAPYIGDGCLLLAAGFVMVTFDLRGHGRSGLVDGIPGYTPKFSDFTNDTAAMLQWAQDRHSGVPSFIWGESMGGVSSTFCRLAPSSMPVPLLSVILLHGIFFPAFPTACLFRFVWCWLCALEPGRNCNSASVST